MNVAVLGGYGNAGRAIVRHTARLVDARFVLMGRNIERGSAAALQLQEETGATVAFREVDASSTADLAHALSGVDILVVASSTMELASAVARTALATDVDYLDIQMSNREKIAALRSMENAILEKERCFITDGGWHPGVPGALVSLAGNRLDEMWEAFVYGAFALDWGARTFSDATVSEFVEEFKTLEPRILFEGEWKSGWKYAQKITFREPYGTKWCSPMRLEELASAPKRFTNLQSCGFFVAGFGALFDYLILPSALALLWIFPGKPHLAGKLFLWGIARFGDKEEGAEIILRTRGSLAGEQKRLEVRLFHTDPYALTAIPVAATLHHYAGKGRRPGLFTQGEFVDPELLLADMRLLGVEVKEQWSEARPQ